MAKNPIGNLAKIVITNATSSNNGVIDKRYLGYADRDIKTIVDAMHSAVNPDTYFSVKQKKFDPSSGVFEVEVFVSADEATNASSAGQYAMGRINHRDEDADQNISYDVSNAERTAYKSGVITLHSSKARKLAQDAITSNGGRLVPPPAGSESDKWEYVMPIPNGADSSYVAELLHPARMESLNVTRKEAIKQQNIKDKDELKRIELQKKDEDKAKNKSLKLIEDADKKAEVERLKKEKQQASEQQKETKKITSFASAKIIALLTAIGDITRRILSSVLTGASKMVDDTRVARNYGLKLKDLQAFSVQEKTFGLSEGTTLDAIADIQSKFGNVTSLDEASLEALAVVMGGDVKDIVKLGIGSSNPNALKDLILDSFSKKALSGYNSVGQYVGQDKARQELVEYLKKISPALSDMLSVFLEAKMNPNSLFRDAKSYSDMQSMVLTNRVGVTELDRAVSSISGQYVKEIQGVFADIKNGITIKLSAKLESILEKLAGSKAFMSPKEKLKATEADITHNLGVISDMQERRRKLGATKSSEYLLNKEVLKYYKGLRNSTEQGKFSDFTLQEAYDFITKGTYNENKYTKSQVEDYLVTLLSDPAYATALLEMGGFIYYENKANMANSNLDSTYSVFVSDDLITSNGFDSMRKFIVPSGNVKWGKLKDWQRKLFIQGLQKFKSAYPNTYKRAYDELLEANKTHGKKSDSYYENLGQGELFYRAYSEGQDKNSKLIQQDGAKFDYIRTDSVDTIINGIKDERKHQVTGDKSAKLIIDVQNNGTTTEQLEYQLKTDGSMDMIGGRDFTLAMDIANIHFNNLG